APRISPAGGARQEAMHFLENRTKEIRTVHAALELRWLSPELSKALSCRGSLVFQAPEHLRLRGTSKAFFTIFDLVAGPEDISIDVPREKVLIRGAKTDPDWSRFAFDPELVSIALLAHPFPARDGSLELREDGADFVWEGDGASMWIDGGNRRPVRFRREEPRTEITWEEWDVIDGISWPRHVCLKWPDEGGVLEIDFAGVHLKKPIRPGYFSKEPEKDRKILTPSEGIERWAEMAEQESLDPDGQ
ncbi:MAG TPA: hypothetical protein VFR10_07930, partial [bacterium]|nr:hypothetical protein [bacterium]